MQGIVGWGDKEIGEGGRGRKTWNECVKVDMNRLGLVKDGVHN